MSSKNYSIKVEDLSKRYSLGQNTSADGLRHVLEGALRNPLQFFKNSKTKDKSKSEFWALDSVSFEVQPGEVVGFIGRNGAGKSTLLKLLSRITVPTKGSISMNGRLASLLEVGTGFHQELTGRENIYLNGAILGMKRLEIKKKFDEIVAFSGVEKFLDTPVKRYSSGMYVRLAFSVAAHLEQEILVVDEVLAVGDREFQTKCIGKMEDVAKNGGRTVLFVSHDMRAVQNLCSRGIILESGRIVYDNDVVSAVAEYSSRLANASTKKLSDRTDRNGNGEAYIKEIEILDSNGDKINAVQTGGANTIRANYKVKANKTLKNCSLSLGIRGARGHITTLSTLYTPNESIDLAGEGYIEFQIPKLPLSESVYYIDAQLKQDDLVELDQVISAASLEVIGGDFFGPHSTEGHHTWNGQFPLTAHSWAHKSGL